MTKKLNDLIDELEIAHQNVKHEYLAWATNQSELINGGVGVPNNRATKTFIRKHCRGRETCLSLLDEIRETAEALNLPERYTLMRELFVIHPSFHELWDFDDHAGYHQSEIIAFKRNGLGKLLETMKAGDGEEAILKASGFLAREAIMLENL